jgi:heme oxygenase
METQLHGCLRAKTRAPHARLERRLDLLTRVARPETRRDVVLRFWRLHVDLEAVAAPWLAGLGGLDFDGRRRTPLLRVDLGVLGLAPTPAGRAPRARSRAEALGWMYVLEGSTLGGQVIRRRLTAAGGDMAGLSFLDPYGPRTGERWRSFLAVLEREAAADPQAAVAGACAGFRHAERRLCGAAVDG